MKRFALVLFLMMAFSLVAQTVSGAWRGLLYDTSRHFPTMDELYSLLPMLKEAHCTVLHLHLVDGPGWRFESKAYPNLTTIGAWRVDKTDKPWNWRATEFWTKAHAQAGKKRYGGYYTAEDLTAFAKVAATYDITIVPEIDVPGHSAALLTAYPEIACPTNQDPKQWFLGKDIICISNPKTLQLLDTVIGELCEAFPGSPIHIGCDEVPHYVWDACPTCRDPKAQKAFYEALIEMVRKRGREVIAWDELALTGVDVSNVTLTCWHDEVTPRSQDIACPYSFCYLDQASSRKRLPTWAPPPNVRGFQFNLWTEELPTRASRMAILKEMLPHIKRLGESSQSSLQKP